MSTATEDVVGIYSHGSRNDAKITHSEVFKQVRGNFGSSRSRAVRHSRYSICEVAAFDDGRQSCSVSLYHTVNTDHLATKSIPGTKKVMGIQGVEKTNLCIVQSGYRASVAQIYPSSGENIHHTYRCICL